MEFSHMKMEMLIVKMKVDALVFSQFLHEHTPLNVKKFQRTLLPTISKSYVEY